ncbi:MAG TPA: DUF5130 family protein [Actinomycetes bacterium]|nr:DUF5130 family protein [Actinomycetes bacterium]
MPAGEAFSLTQRVSLERAIKSAESQSGLGFSVYVGPLGDDVRARARSLHAAVPGDTARLVLVAVDVAGRRVEIVTGSQAHLELDDASCGLAALSMTTSFGAGDLVGGIVDGLTVLAEHARHPRILHTDQP